MKTETVDTVPFEVFQDLADELKNSPVSCSMRMIKKADNDNADDKIIWFG